MQKQLLQYMLGVKPEDLSTHIIVTPFIPLKKFKVEFDLIEKSFSGQSQYKGFTGTKNGQRVSIINTGIGASLVGDIVCWLKGIAEVVLLAGSAGALNEQFEIGEYFIAQEAIDGEGFSQHYLKNHREAFITASRSYAHEKSLQRLSELKIKQGIVYTIGSINSEDNVFLELLKNQKVDVIDMETSAFYTAAFISKIKAIAACFISDMPLKKPFYQKLSSDDQLKLNYAVEGFPRTTLDLLVSV